MKTKVIPAIIILGAILFLAHRITTLAKHNRLISQYDYVMSDPVAVSNAAYFGKPPEGWTIVCNNNGKYAPKSPLGNVPDYAGGTFVKNNKSDAIVSAWKLKLAFDKPSAPVQEPLKTEWKDCE